MIGMALGTAAVVATALGGGLWVRRWRKGRSKVALCTPGASSTNAVAMPRLLVGGAAAENAMPAKVVNLAPQVQRTKQVLREGFAPAVVKLDFAAESGPAPTTKTAAGETPPIVVRFTQEM